MKSYKHLFSRSLSADPARLHFAAHSHHLWPDASFEGQMACWTDAAELADHKWDKVMGPVWEEAQGHIARELSLPDPATLCFAPNTHDFLVRLVSSLPDRPVRVLATNGEFHSFTRQMARWAESGEVILDQVAPADLMTAAWTGGHDLIFASQILFGTGEVIADLELLASLGRPEGPWVLIDGYHGFMATPTDLTHVGAHAFYVAGGYKYAMAGEGVAFLHAPPGFAARPEITGWYAAFDELAEAQGKVTYATDGRRFLGSTFDPSGLYRFNAVQRMLATEGLTTAAISAHVTALQQQFVTEAAMPGLTLLNPVAEGARARFLAYKGSKAASLCQQLAAHNVVTDVRGDVLRIGFGLYQDEEDVDRLVRIVARCDVARGD